MSNIKTITGDDNISNARIAIVVTQFNSFIVDLLLEAALTTLQNHGIEQTDIEVVQVPGAFEIPLTTKKLAKTKRFDAIIALGAVIRGETPHFDYIASVCADGVAEVSLQFEIPVIFGVLTVDSVAQANDRAGGSKGNKGADAAQAAIQMIGLLRKLT